MRGNAVSMFTFIALIMRNSQFPKRSNKLCSPRPSVWRGLVELPLAGAPSAPAGPARAGTVRVPVGSSLAPLPAPRLTPRCPQARAATLHSCVIIIRVLRDLCRRVPIWTPLDPYVSRLHLLNTRIADSITHKYQTLMPK